MCAAPDLAAAPSAVHGTNDSAEGGGGIGSEAAGFAAWCASGHPSVSAAEREECEERSPGERERPGGESARSDAGDRDREEYGVAGGEGYGERRLRAPAAELVRGKGRGVSA